MLEHYHEPRGKQPLERTDVSIDGLRMPLESDITTPLAYFMNDPIVGTNALSTFAMLDADFAHGRQV